MRMPIPNDWDGQTFCNYVVKWPDSPLWRIILRGVCSNPNLENFWDERTGDVQQTIADFEEALEYLIDELRCESMNGLPLGTILGWVTHTPPDGFLICNGGPANKADYPDLYNLIGDSWEYDTPYDPQTQFCLPDFRGRVAVGYDFNVPEFDALAEAGGRARIFLEAGDIPGHQHTLAMDVMSRSNNGNITVVGQTPYIPLTGTLQVAQNKLVTQLLHGGNTAHDNLQPYMTMNYIIRALP